MLQYRLFSSFGFLYPHFHITHDPMLLLLSSTYNIEIFSQAALHDAIWCKHNHKYKHKLRHLVYKELVS